MVGQRKLLSNGEVFEFLGEVDESIEVVIEVAPGLYRVYHHSGEE